MQRRRKHKVSELVKRPSSSLSPAHASLLLALVALPALFNIQSGASFEPDKAALFISLAAVALLDSVWRYARAWPAGLRSPLGLLLTGLSIWALLITLTAIDPVTSLWGNYHRGYGLLTLLAGITFLFVAWEMARSGDAWLIIDAALLGAVIPILYGFLQLLNLDPVRGFGISFPLGQRAAATLGNPLFLGDYLLIILMLGLARRVLQPPAPQTARRLLESHILLTGLLLLLTFSRSAYLGLLIAAASLPLFGKIEPHSASKQAPKALRAAPDSGPGHIFGRRWRLLIGVLALSGGLLTLHWLWPKLQHGGTLQQRLLIWQAILDLIRSQPRLGLTGLGFDTLPLALAPHLSPTLAHFEPDFAFRIPDRAHNLLLELLIVGGLPWLLGWLSLAAILLRRLHRSSHPLAPWLAAILLARGILLLFSFPTIAPDLLFWSLLGLSLAITAPEPPIPLAPCHECLIWPALAAWGVFGFSLSAAWPGGLFLWLLAALPLSLILNALAPITPTQLPAHGLMLLLLLPAILLNQHIGYPAQAAWLWLMAWLMAILVAAVGRPAWRPILTSSLLLLLIALPRLGDIAYKSALLTPDPIRKERSLHAALSLAPYDHVMAAGVAWTESHPTPSPISPQLAQEVNALYQQAIQAQPLAPEPRAQFARWLAVQAQTDPTQIPATEAAFAAALARSPHDIQTRNDQALFWAQTGRLSEAIVQFRQLLTLDPLYAPTYVNLARAYRQAGDEAAARAILQTGRERIPWWSGWDKAAR